MRDSAEVHRESECHQGKQTGQLIDYNPVIKVPTILDIPLSSRSINSPGVVAKGKPKCKQMMD